MSLAAASNRPMIAHDERSADTLAFAARFVPLALFAKTHTMRRTFITALITALVTSLCWYGASVANGVRRGIERVWLMSAVKAPGRMALDDIEADLTAGRFETAKAKIAALRQQWAVFDSEAGFRGQAIGNIMVALGQIDSRMEATPKAEPGGPANASQPSRSGTNRTPRAAVSRR